MHTYRYSSDRKQWAVVFMGEREHIMKWFGTEELAAAYSNYLNGGSGQAEGARWLLSRGQT